MTPISILGPTLGTTLSLALAVALAPSDDGGDDAAQDAAREPVVLVNAYLLADELVVGRSYEVAVEVTLAEGVSLADAGIPAPLLQLDVPPSVRLVGEVLDTHEELSRNDFVDEPYERLLDELPARFAFELVAEPKADETLGLNVVGYARGAGGEERFLRRRLELPLEAGAAALEVPARTSRWGADRGLLQIGDRAADFTLPRADGSELALSQLLGEGKVLVLTYRAHW